MTDENTAGRAEGPDGGPRFERLAALLPELEARTGSGLTFDWSGTPPTFDGLAERLYEITHSDDCILEGFDWPALLGSSLVYLEPGGVERADLEVCRRLLTMIVRQERFVENSLSEHIESGFAARLVRRLVELTTKENRDG